MIVVCEMKRQFLALIVAFLFLKTVGVVVVAVINVGPIYMVVASPKVSSSHPTQ